MITILGCDSGTGIEAEKQKWADEGWTFVETVGVPIEDAEYVSHLSSPTASSITAFATGSPDPIEKEYQQSEQIYLIVTMATDPTATFSLVFSKAKPDSPESH